MRGRFGQVEKLPSGRYRARYVGPDGVRRSAPVTFRTKTDAGVWLATVEADIVRRVWRAPEDENTRTTRPTMAALIEKHLARPEIRWSSKDLYARVWRLHMADFWADVAVEDVTSTMIRTWHEAKGTEYAERAAAAKAAGKTGRETYSRRTQLAHSYQLLHALLERAVADEVIPANPARLRGASTAKRERPARMLSEDELVAAAAQLPDRYRVMALVGGYCTLRFGELAGLRRCDVARDARLITVAEQVYRRRRGAPKSEAGQRPVRVPAFLAERLLEHLERFVGDDPLAPVFATAGGLPPSSSNVSRMWHRAQQRAGITKTAPWHSTRHTAGTMAAQEGATTKELMDLMGHASPRASLIYQHAAAERLEQIAARLDARHRARQAPPEAEG